MAQTTTTIEFKPLEEIDKFLRRFVIFSDDAHAEVIALWVLHTWAFDAAYATPYIYVHSAEPQSGKTRTMEVTQLLARESISAGNISAAGLFSVIGSSAPAVFIDEVDAVFTGAANEELRGVLNSGYKQGGNVMRFVGKLSEDGTREVASFSTFCPKMLVGIDNGAMPDTIRDRCIPLQLKRKKTSQEVERYLPRIVEPQAEELRRKIEAWATKNIERILSVDPNTIKALEGVSDRAFEIAEPLLILARVAGGKQAENRARKALTSLLAGQAPKLSPGIQALQAAKELLDEAKMDRLSSAILAAHLGVSPKKLGVLLQPYGITPSTIRFPSGEKVKGYYRRDFQDAWERYL